MREIQSLRGLTVALTGRGSESRRALTRLIREKGGKVVRYPTRVTGNTDILVRGQSDLWKYGTFGRKEAKAAELVRGGSQLSLILSEDLDRLLAGRPVEEYPYVAGQHIATLHA